MQGPGTPTFDQLNVFLAVVEAGSFAAAGRRLKRATSVVSYAVANLELQLGVCLFDRASTRKPQLTEAGRAVLAEARTVAHGIDALRAKVAGLLGGLESEVSIAVDVMLPTDRLVDALKAFQESFPTVDLRLHVEALGAITQTVVDRRAVIGVSGPIATGIDGIERVAVGSVELAAVAAPTHPLARAAHNGPGAARDHIQLVLSDRSSLTQGRDFAVLATHTWRLADLGAKHALLLAGIGWGSMPAPMVEADVAAGRLVLLDIPEAMQRRLNFSAIYRTDTPPGPAARWLIRRLAEQAGLAH